MGIERFLHAPTAFSRLARPALLAGLFLIGGPAAVGAQYAPDAAPLRTAAFHERAPTITTTNALARLPARSVIFERLRDEQLHAVADAPHGIDTSCYLSETQMRRIAARKRRTPYRIAHMDSVTTMVLHRTAGSDASSFHRLCDIAGSHYGVKPDGTLLLFAPEYWQSDAVGISEYNGRKNVNDFSLNVEIFGYDRDGLTPAQIETTRWLIAQRAKGAHGLAAEDVTAHYLVAYSPLTAREKKLYGTHAIGKRGRRTDGIYLPWEELGLKRPVDTAVLSGRVLPDPIIEAAAANGYVLPAPDTRWLAHVGLQLRKLNGELHDGRCETP